MGKNGTGRRSPWDLFGDLFAERQVHMRSGRESRYVVLSRPLQIGVTLGFLAAVALLALASYNAIAKHLALTAQQRILAEERAATEARADQSARQLASLRQRSEAAEREIERLSAALGQAWADRSAALTASSEAGAKAAELEAALAAAAQASREPAEGDARSAPGSARGSAPGSAKAQALLAEVTGLRAELARVKRETEVLRRRASEARQALRALQGGQPPQARPGPGATPPLRLAAAMPGGDEVRQLQEDLADAQTTVASLSADLEALKGASGPASDAAATLATLKEQLDAAHRRVELLGVGFAARPSDEAGAAPDAAPLPPPPAPR